MTSNKKWTDTFRFEFSVYKTEALTYINIHDSWILPNYLNWEQDPTCHRFLLLILNAWGFLFLFVSFLLMSKYGPRRCFSAAENAKPVFTMPLWKLCSSPVTAEKVGNGSTPPALYFVHCYIQNGSCGVPSEPTGKQTEAGTAITPEHIVNARASLPSPKMPIIPKPLIDHFFKPQTMIFCWRLFHTHDWSIPGGMLAN